MHRQITSNLPNYPNFSSKKWYGLSATFGMSSVLLFKLTNYLLTEVDYSHDGRPFVTNLVVGLGLTLGCAAASCQFFNRARRAATAEQLAASTAPADAPQKNKLV